MLGYIGPFGLNEYTHGNESCITWAVSNSQPAMLVIDRCAWDVLLR